MDTNSRYHTEITNLRTISIQEKGIPVMQIFSVYDAKAEAFLQPFFAPTVGVALRMFEAAITDQNHEFCKHAPDYTIFHVGEFFEDSGQLVARAPILALGNALTLQSQLMWKEPSSFGEESRNPLDNDKTVIDLRTKENS